MFWGNSYIYPTPNAGDRPIGVTRGLGGVVYIVAFVNPVTGGRHRIRTKNLQPDTNPDRLQRKLDQWAADRRLRRCEQESA